MLRRYGPVAPFSVIWSSAFVGGKLAVADLDPSIVLFLRFSLSALVLAPVAIADAARNFSAETPLRGLALGLLNNTIYLGLSFVAIRQISQPW